MPQLQINVVNFSSQSVQVFVSKYNGGSDDWFTLAPGAGDNWTRNAPGWELVAFLKPDGDRGGVYVKVGSKVHYYNVNNIQVVSP